MHITPNLVEDLNAGKVVVSDVGTTIPGIVSTEDKLFFLYETCSAAVQDSLEPEKVSVAIRAAGLDADGQWTKQNLAQIIWLISQEIHGQEQLFSKLKDVVQELIKVALVSKTELLQVASTDFLAELGVVTQQQSKNKEGIVRGNVFFKITKFNLLREENEGFSKILVRLQSFGSEAAAHPESVEQMLMEIRSLIGYFDLDPNRVAALVLDVFQAQWENLAYLALFPLFSPTAIYSSLGFIFDGYKAAGEVVPDSLYHMSIQLVKHGVFHMDELWRRLSPEDNTIAELQKIAQASTLKAWQKRHALSNTGPKPGQAQAPSEGDTIVTKTSYGMAAEALNLDPRQIGQAALQPLWDNNQKLELLRVACQMQEVDTAWALFKGLKASGMEPADYPPVNDWLAKRAIAGISKPSNTQDMLCGVQTERVPRPTMTPEAQRILDIMGLSFSMSNELWIRVVRFWKDFLRYHQQEPAAMVLGLAQDSVCQELMQRILPGMMLMSPDAFLANEVWSLLQLLPYSVRYEVYEVLAAVPPSRPDAESSIDVILRRAAYDNIGKMIRRVATRMSTDQNVKHASAAQKVERQKQEKLQTWAFAKLSHANPITATDSLVDYAVQYGTHIESLTDLFKHLSDFTLDVLTYRIIKRFARAGPTSRYKPDGVLVKEPLANISKLTAACARKLMRDNRHGSSGGIELHAILQMVCNAAKANRNEAFLILADLMDITAGVHALENPGDSELPALAGGEVLKTVKITKKEVRAASKVARAGMDRLADALTTTKYGRPLAVPLFILLAQNRHMLIKGIDKGTGDEAPPKPGQAQPAESRVRTVCDRYDQMNKFMVQYADFLRSALVKHKYKELMPSLSDLLDPTKFGLEPEVAYLLYRPILSRVPFPENPSLRNPPPEDGEIPEGEEVMMQVEKDTEWDGVRWSHLCQAVLNSLPAAAERGLGKPFYLLFWRLTYADISWPEAAYDQQVKQLQREQKELQRENDDFGYVGHMKHIEHPDDRKIAVKHNKGQMEVAKEHIRLLEKEKIKMKEKWVEGEKFLKQWKNDMLADVDHTETIEAFVFHCILPRCVLTPEDAMYCAFFIRKLTLEDTPYFSYLLAVRMIINPCGGRIMFSLTEREADNFGIFMRELLMTAKEWMLDEKYLDTDLRLKPGFRLDGRTFSSNRSVSLTGAKSTLSRLNTIFIGGVGSILKANMGIATDNWRVTVNALLILDKLKTVCPLFYGHAKSLLLPLKKIYTRLQPPKDRNGNFTEQPQALYNLALRCWSDLQRIIAANEKYDAAVEAKKPLPEFPQTRLYNKLDFDPQAPPQKAPVAGTAKPPAAPAKAAAAAAKQNPAQPGTDRQDAASPVSAPTGKAQDAVSPGRGEKAAPAAEAQAPKRDAKSSARPQSPARDNAIPADGKDIGTARGAKEQGARGSAREHADKPSTRDSRHATAATARSPDATSDRGKDDLAAARAAALERKQSTNGDASAKAAHQRRASPSKGEKSKRDVREKDVVAYGVAPTAGTKRRAADATKPADLRDTTHRGSKAAKVDVAASKQADVPEAKLNGTAATPASTRRTGVKAATGSATKSELRADAAPFTPSHADVPTPKRPPGDPNDPPRKPPGLDKVPIKSEPQSSSKRTADNAVKRTAVDPKAPAKPSADSVPVKEEASVADRVKREGQAAQQSTARAASKRPREDPAAETSRAGSKVPKQAAAEESKAAADPDLQNEPKRRKHKPIEFKVPAASEADMSVERRLASEDRTESHKSRHADQHPSRLPPSAESEAKHAQHDVKSHAERDRSRARDSGKSEASEAKRAEHEHRDSRTARVEPKHAQRESKYELDRAKRDAERAREQRSKEPSRHREADRDEPSRHRDSDRERRRTSPSRRHSLGRSEEKKSAGRVMTAEEREDGEVHLAEPESKPQPADPERHSQSNGGNAETPPGAAVPALEVKADSDGRDSKKGHKHKKKDKKEKKDHDKKRDKKDKKEKRKHKEKEKEKERDGDQALASPTTQHPAAAAEAPANAPTATAGPAVASAAKVGNKVEASEGAQVPSRQAATVAEPSSRQAAAAARAEERHSATSTDANAAPAAKGLAQNDLRHLLSRKPGGNQPPEGQPEQRPSLTSRLGTVTRSEPEPRAQAQRTERAGRTQHAQRRIEIDEQPRMTRQPSRHA